MEFHAISFDDSILGLLVEHLEAQLSIKPIAWLMLVVGSTGTAPVKVGWLSDGDWVLKARPPDSW